MLEKIQEFFAKKQPLSQKPRLALPPVDADPELGLTAAQTLERREFGWEAGTPVPPGKTEQEIILSHCFTFFNLIFVVMGVLLLIAGSSILNMGFLLVAVINTVIGIVQEIRAKRAVDKLTLVAARPVRVIREGKTASM